MNLPDDARLYKSPECQRNSNFQPVRSIRVSYAARPNPPCRDHSINAGCILTLAALFFIMLIWGKNPTPGQSKHELKELAPESNRNQSEINSGNLVLNIKGFILSNPGIVVQGDKDPYKAGEEVLKQFTENIELKQLGIIPRDDQTTIRDLSQYKQLTLSIIKHEKLTSVLKNYSSIWGSIINTVWQQNPYSNIDVIFQIDNQQPWKSDGNLLTISSQKHFSPRAFVIKVEKPNKLYIFGLVIEETPFAVNKQISKYFLGSRYLQPGMNILVCSEMDCFRQYSMIAIIMDPMDVLHIGIYSRELSTEQSNDDL